LRQDEVENGSFTLFDKMPIFSLYFLLAFCIDIPGSQYSILSRAIYQFPEQISQVASTGIRYNLSSRPRDSGITCSGKTVSIGALFVCLSFRKTPFAGKSLFPGKENYVHQS
jgi:hypothetical protein